MRKGCIVFIAILFASASIGDILYVSKGNIFDGFFKEPYEACVFLMSDGAFYLFTTRNDGFVSGSVSHWSSLLKPDGYTIEDAIIIMHNHFSNPFPSEPDKRTLTQLIMLGFDGKFGIYVTSTSKIYWIKD